MLRVLENEGWIYPRRFDVGVQKLLGYGICIALLFCTLWDTIYHHWRCGMDRLIAIVASASFWLLGSRGANAFSVYACTCTYGVVFCFSAHRNPQFNSNRILNNVQYHILPHPIPRQTKPIKKENAPYNALITYSRPARSPAPRDSLPGPANSPTRR